MSNLTFEWGGLSKDFLGRPLVPGHLTSTHTGAIYDASWPCRAVSSRWGQPQRRDALNTADSVVSPPLNLLLAGATSWP